MTATSGPGISLMAEYVGYGYFAEIPGVIFDIQRAGPSTGLPTRTMQGDVSFCYSLGHGDTKHVVLLPATIAEAYEFAMAAFDLADRLQTPVLVLSDLDFGMNSWMTPPLAYPERLFDRGKVLRRTISTGWKAGPLPRRRSRRHRVPHAPRHQALPRPASSPGAPDTTKRPVTPNHRRCGSATSIALPANMRPRAPWYRSRSSKSGAPRSASRLRHHPPRGRGSARHLARRRNRGRLPPHTGLTGHGRGRGLHRTARAGVRGRAEPRRPTLRHPAPGAADRSTRARPHRSAITTGSRSTRTQ